MAKENNSINPGDSTNEMSRQKDLLWHFMDNSADSVFIINDKAAFVYANQTASEKLGYSRDEFLNMQLPAIAPRLSMDEWPEFWESLLEKKKLSWTTIHSHKDGSTVPITVTTQFMQIGDEGFCCATTQALSETGQLERELQAFSETISGGLNYVVVIDEDMRVQGSNQKNAEWYGQSIEEMIGKKYEELGDHPEILKGVEKTIARCLGGETFSIQAWIPRPTGGLRYLDISYTPLTLPDSGKTFAIVSADDLTELKQVQESATKAHGELKSHIANSPLGVIQWDSEMRVTAWNEQAERIFGWSSEEAVGTIVRKLKFVHEDDLAEANLKLEGLRNGDYSNYIHHNRNYSKGGELLHCVWHVSALYDADGNLQSMLGLVQDVTQQEVASAQLKEYQEKLENLVESRTRELKDAQDELLRKERLAALGELTGTVGHELRNPLGTIRFSLHFIRDNNQLLGDKNISALERVDRNIDRCDQIISELLEFTREPILNQASTYLTEWLQTLLNEYEIPSSIEFSSDLQANVTIKIDQGRIQRCVINLVSNAIDALQENPPDKPRELRVTSRTRNGRLEIEVIDTGPGIDEQYIGKVTEPLFSTKSFGIGLGLPVVKQTMKRHHGGMDITSTKGVGTRVLIWIPLEN